MIVSLSRITDEDERFFGVLCLILRDGVAEVNLKILLVTIDITANIFFQIVGTRDSLEVEESVALVDLAGNSVTNLKIGRAHV